jgi:predicted transcriptional regulator
MAKTTTMTLRVTPKTRAELDKLARTTKRTKADLVSEAISSLADHNAWLTEEIKRAVEDADRPDSLWVKHEEVEAWVASQRTDTPLPRPKGKPRSRL